MHGSNEVAVVMTGTASVLRLMVKLAADSLQLKAGEMMRSLPARSEP